MMTAASLAQVLEQARHLVDRDEHEQAAEAYLVAADLAEEQGEAGLARSARTSARRNLVVAWAQKRWPDVQNEDVWSDRTWPGQWGRKEITRFIVRRRHVGETTAITVAINRRGRVSRVVR